MATLMRRIRRRPICRTFPCDEDDPEGCKVVFFIEYEFKNRALGMVMGSMFDYAFRRFAVAFEERAAKVYGAPGA